VTVCRADFRYQAFTQACAFASPFRTGSIQGICYLSASGASPGSSGPPNTSSIAQVAPQATNTIMEPMNAMPELSPIGLATRKTTTAIPAIALMTARAARLIDATITGWTEQMITEENRRLHSKPVRGRFLAIANASTEDQVQSDG